MNLGIIGASGVLGSNLLRHLAMQGKHTIRCQNRSGTGSTAHLATDWMTFKLSDSLATARFLDGLDAIFYLAHKGVPGEEKSWIYEEEQNLPDFLHFLESVKIAGEKKDTPLKLIYASSGGAIYGPSASKTPWRESDSTNPAGSYGVLKLAAEHFLRVASDRGHCRALALRISNPYGNHFPHEKMQGLIDVLARKIRNNEIITISANLNTVRDYIHMDDLNRAFEASLELTSGFQIINIGSGVGRSIREVLDAFKKHSVAKTEFQLSESQNQSIINWSVLDISKAKKILNWSPTVEFSESIRRFQA
jgi:UDP-glucose 4-epimerase